MGRTMETDATYYIRRADEERIAAANATDDRVRQRHVELAQGYEMRAQFMTGDKRDTQVHHTCAGE